MIASGKYLPRLGEYVALLTPMSACCAGHVLKAQHSSETQAAVSFSQATNETVSSEGDGLSSKPHSSAAVWDERTRNEKALRDGLFAGLVEGKRSSLAEAITCVESTKVDRPWSGRWKGEKLVEWSLEELRKRQLALGRNVSTLRIGLSGSPGAGKSTFLEALGCYLTTDPLQHKVACLTVDPSSRLTGGSLLGDKTRMPNLTRSPRAFIRPSPSRGAVGGVTRSTSEAILLCEAAGYDLVFVETVGAGQNEFVVGDMVDIFVVLVAPGSGDELQAMKRGLMEMCDLIVVNKADGDLLAPARRTQAEYISALKFMRHRPTLGTAFDWNPQVVRVSSITQEGIAGCWESILKFKAVAVESGFLLEKRRHQNVQRMWRFLFDEVQSLFCESQPEEIARAEAQVLEGKMAASAAADKLLNRYREFIAKENSKTKY